MRKGLALLITCSALLGGCVVAPYDDGYRGGGPGPGCPPGQAKKGNCRVDPYGNESFCPPGQAKKGNC
ncbi:hypothetical protein BKK79_01070 [Cupriavidus sp. USMAA2-4]|uniref:Lipoprotein n=1 Tax=Cupriavidus malaysiensis TaxID=367825 RepID=A0A1D9I2U8_9BURK|nr:hypothetical protein [Cupriavidus sp. USMAA2-4]AOY90576.1 hypothetical protein BKK79_01070 [Cupriavidus sp. USMAA2-4]AOY99798.1 hypothetical protein BKK81_11505 [Cupriavidus sp. USMAHM13]AOZ06424.1 hypothetical protein BKK80_11775 [Cupriavidus malaysiensis]